MAVKYSTELRRHQQSLEDGQRWRCDDVRRQAVSNAGSDCVVDVAFLLLLMMMVMVPRHYIVSY